MNQGEPTRPDPAELAALYAAGALSPQEAASFEQDLAHSAADREQLRELTQAILALGSTATVEPPAAVRSVLMERAAGSAPAGVSRAPRHAWTILREAEGQWRESGIPGIRIKTLSLDRAQNLHTFLIRGEARSSLPAHPHPGVEQCLVLEGDLHTCGQVLTVGDYFRAEAGSVHDATYTEKGCLLLMVSAIGDHVDSV